MSISRSPASCRAWWGGLQDFERRSGIPVLVHNTWRDFQCHGSSDNEESHLTTKVAAAVRVLRGTDVTFKGLNAEC